MVDSAVMAAIEQASELAPLHNPPALAVLRAALEVVLNDLDRFHLAVDVIDRVPKLGTCAAYLKQNIDERPVEHKIYIREHSQEMPEIAGWRWGTGVRSDRLAGVPPKRTNR